MQARLRPHERGGGHFGGAVLGHRHRGSLGRGLSRRRGGQGVGDAAGKLEGERVARVVARGGAPAGGERPLVLRHERELRGQAGFGRSHRGGGRRAGGEVAHLLAVVGRDDIGIHVLAVGAGGAVVVAGRPAHRVRGALVDVAARGAQHVGSGAGNERVGMVEHVAGVHVLGLVGGERRLVQQRVHIHHHVLGAHAVGAPDGVREPEGGVAHAGVREEVARRAAGMSAVQMVAGEVVLAQTRQVGRLGARGVGRAVGIGSRGGGVVQVLVHLGQVLLGRAHREGDGQDVAHFHHRGGVVGTVHRAQARVVRAQLRARIQFVLGNETALAGIVDGPVVLAILILVVHDQLDLEQAEGGLVGDVGAARVDVVVGLAPSVDATSAVHAGVVDAAVGADAQLAGDIVHRSAVVGRLLLGADERDLHLQAAGALSRHRIAVAVGPVDVLQGAVLVARVQHALQVSRIDLGADLIRHLAGAERGVVAGGLAQVVQRDALEEHRVVQLALAGVALVGAIDDEVVLDLAGLVVIGDLGGGAGRVRERQVGNLATVLAPVDRAVLAVVEREGVGARIEGQHIVTTRRTAHEAINRVHAGAVVAVAVPIQPVVARLGLDPPIPRHIGAVVKRERDVHRGGGAVASLVARRVGLRGLVVNPVGTEAVGNRGHLGVVDGVAVPEGLAGHVPGLLGRVLVVGARGLSLGLEDLVLELGVGVLAIDADGAGLVPLVLERLPGAVLHVLGDGVAELVALDDVVLIERAVEVQRRGLVVVVVVGHVHRAGAVEVVGDVLVGLAHGAGVGEAHDAIEHHVVQMEGGKPIGGGGHVEVGPAHGRGLAEQVDVVHATVLDHGVALGKTAELVGGAEHHVGATLHEGGQRLRVLILGEPGAQHAAGHGGHGLIVVRIRRDGRVLIGHVNPLGVGVDGALQARGVIGALLVGVGQRHVVLHAHVLAALGGRRALRLGGRLALPHGLHERRVAVGGLNAARGVGRHIGRVVDVVAVHLEDAVAHRRLGGGVELVGEVHRHADIVRVERGVVQTGHREAQRVAVLVGRGVARGGAFHVAGIDGDVVLVVVAHARHAAGVVGLGLAGGRPVVAVVQDGGHLAEAVAVGARGRHEVDGMASSVGRRREGLVAHHGVDAGSLAVAGVAVVVEAHLRFDGAAVLQTVVQVGDRLHRMAVVHRVERLVVHGLVDAVAVGVGLLHLVLGVAVARGGRHGVDRLHLIGRVARAIGIVREGVVVLLVVGLGIRFQLVGHLGDDADVDALAAQGLLGLRAHGEHERAVRGIVLAGGRIDERRLGALGRGDRGGRIVGDLGEVGGGRRHAHGDVVQRGDGAALAGDRLRVAEERGRHAGGLGIGVVERDVGRLRRLARVHARSIGRMRLGDADAVVGAHGVQLHLVRGKPGFGGNAVGDHLPADDALAAAHGEAGVHVLQGQHRLQVRAQIQRVLQVVAGVQRAVGHVVGGVGGLVAEDVGHRAVVGVVGEDGVLAHGRGTVGAVTDSRVNLAAADVGDVHGAQLVGHAVGGLVIDKRGQALGVGVFRLQIDGQLVTGIGARIGARLLAEGGRGIVIEVAGVGLLLIGTLKHVVMGERVGGGASRGEQLHGTIDIDAVVLEGIVHHGVRLRGGRLGGAHVVLALAGEPLAGVERRVRETTVGVGGLEGDLQFGEQGLRVGLVHLRVA